MAVYFARVGDYFKIGYAADPFQRIRTITRSGLRPDEVPFNSSAKLIGWIPGDRWQEGAWHARFIDDRVVGEWFLDLDERDIQDLIWEDPRGVVLERMSAVAVFSAADNPAMTRDELAAAGVQVEATPLEDALGRIGDWLTPPSMRGGAA